MAYQCRYNTELKCDSECCDRCTNHPMYLKGRKETLEEIVWSTQRDKFDDTVECLKKLSTRPYMGYEEERTLKTLTIIMDRIQKQLEEIEKQQ